MYVKFVLIEIAMYVYDMCVVLRTIDNRTKKPSRIYRMCAESDKPPIYMHRVIKKCLDFCCFYLLNHARSHYITVVHIQYMYSCMYAVEFNIILYPSFDSLEKCSFFSVQHTCSIGKSV